MSHLNLKGKDVWLGYLLCLASASVTIWGFRYLIHHAVRP